MNDIDQIFMNLKDHRARDFSRWRPVGAGALPKTGVRLQVTGQFQKNRVK